MKEIKFRVIIRELGEIVGYERLSPTNGWMHCLACEGNPDSPLWRPGVIDRGMQEEMERLPYINKLDSNGAEIYMGDIITLKCTSSFELKAAIQWTYRGNTGWFPKIIDESIYSEYHDKHFSTLDVHSNCGSHYCLWPHNIGLVIGNTYQNPELLKATGS